MHCKRAGGRRIEKKKLDKEMRIENADKDRTNSVNLLSSEIIISWLCHAFRRVCFRQK